MAEKLSGGTLIPAYGRDVSNRAQCVEMLNKGLDFTISNHQFQGYCSIRDLDDGHFQVRDFSLRKVWTVKIKSGIAS